jgi:hypothetical protein
MSEPADSLSDAGELAVELCWNQWRSLAGETLPADIGPRVMIDPEALVLASLVMRSKERRLDDMLLGMAEEPALLSVQRLKSLARIFPASLAPDIAWFASVARSAGDARWRSLAPRMAEHARGRAGKSMPRLSLTVERAFMLRMRSGLGVGIKADLVACLEGMKRVSNHHAGGLTVSELAQVLTYSKNATRRALDEMVRANVAVRLDGRPSRHRLGHIYFQSFDPGAPSGTRATIPAWGYCSQVFAILCACHQFLSDPRIRELDETVKASRLRDLSNAFDGFWEWFGVAPVDAKAFPGPRFTDGFSRVLEAVMDWARERL